MLLPCMFPDNHLYVESCIQRTYPRIFPQMLNPSASFSITHEFVSRRALVPIPKPFTVDVRVSLLSLALCLINYLLHTGEGHLQCCVGMVLRLCHSSSPSAAISDFAPYCQQAYQKSKTQLIVVPNSSLMLNCTMRSQLLGDQISFHRCII